MGHEITNCGSDKVTEASWYGIARHTANLRRLIEHLDLRRITLFCQDWGGPTGLAQVAEMPDRFERLVIMNTWLHHEGYEYTPGILDWIERNRPGGLLHDNIPGRLGWGSIMAMATGRVSPAEVLGPILTGGEVITEELGLKLGFGCGGAMGHHEGLGATSRFGVEGARHQFLAGPRLTE